MSCIEKIGCWMRLTVLLVIMCVLLWYFLLYIWGNRRIKKIVMDFAILLICNYVITSILLVLVYIVDKDERWIILSIQILMLDAVLIRDLISLWRDKKLNTDAGYKMFYGEWELNPEPDSTSEFIHEKRSMADRKVVFTSRESCYCVSEKTIIRYPDYIITITSTDKSEIYLPRTVSFHEFGIENMYVTIFSVKNGGDVFFIIKDDETLLMVYNETYFELKRKKYLTCKHQLTKGDKEKKDRVGRLRRKAVRDEKQIETDEGYKMFYGKWEINKAIDEFSDMNMSEYSHSYRKTVILDDWKCIYYKDKKERRIGYPKYDIIIIPLDENTAHFPDTLTMNDMGIYGSYVAIIHIRGIEDVFFIIKDDDTLVMCDRRNYLELKRTGYMQH